MRRRIFLAGLTGAVTAMPLGARAQQRAMQVIGFLHSASAQRSQLPDSLFSQALSELGFTEGRNVFFEQRYADDHYDLLPNLAAELVHHPVSVIVAVPLPPARAAKAATTTLPIVFWDGGDPVADGLVTNLAHPGGNLTGVATFNSTLGAKRLKLLRALLPSASSFALLTNPANSNVESQAKDVQEAARAIGVQLLIVSARTAAEVNTAFAAMADQHVEGVLIGADPFIFLQKDAVITLAARYGIASICTLPEYVKAGALMSYTSSAPMHYELGNYVGRILNGERPGDLPIQRSSKFTLAINLKTARSLGLTMPQMLLAQADEVIE